MPLSNPNLEKFLRNKEIIAGNTPESRKDGKIETINQESKKNKEQELNNRPESAGELESPISKAISSLTQRLKTQKKKPVILPQLKGQMTIQVEKIMEEGLEDAFKELTTVQKQAFKLKGEETAYKITELLKSTKVKIKKIFLLLVDWLRMLPGINKFYLEQEAKIKADKILALKGFGKNK